MAHLVLIYHDLPIKVGYVDIAIFRWADRRMQGIKKTWSTAPGWWHRNGMASDWMKSDHVRSIAQHGGSTMINYVQMPTKMIQNACLIQNISKHPLLNPTIWSWGCYVPAEAQSWAFSCEADVGLTDRNAVRKFDWRHVTDYRCGYLIIESHIMIYYVDFLHTHTHTHAHIYIYYIYTYIHLYVHA